MKRIGFIPLRKNSKGIPGKNTRKFLGRSLFCWVLTEAVLSRLDEVFVFTDDDWVIKFIEEEYNWNNKIKVLKRSDDNATDIASTEMAISEFCKLIEYNFDVFVLLQATSVFTSAEDINTCLDKIENGFDSALSVVRKHRFLWSEDGKPMNYNPERRPRRQDFKGHLVENGAVYATSKNALVKSGIRISGKIATVIMSEISYTEIDSEADWDIAERLMESQLKQKKSLGRIDKLILDVDGVFTDGKVLYDSKGELAKSFDMRDGMGLEILSQYGVEVIVLTSENSELVGSRMKKLNIDKVFLGIKDKFGFLGNLIDQKAWSYKNIAYVGDDVNDMACMCRAAWSFAPGNAMTEIKRIADLQGSKSSGDGAIREAAIFITKFNKRFDKL